MTENNNENDESSCCGKPKKKPSNWMQGLIYGLVPHIGCIGFIIGSIFGVTMLMQFFKPLLMNRYFFHYLIGLSLVFATISSILFLRKHNQLSMAGVRSRWKYLTGMYGSTIGINLVLFMLIFPLLANVSIASPVTGNVIADSVSSLSSITLSVDIPCPGHAPLISNELKTVLGVQDIKFSFPNDFEVQYDSSLTSKNDMLALDVFDEYPAEVIAESEGSLSSTEPSTSYQQSKPVGACSSGASSCGSTESSSCGGSCGSSSGGSCGGSGSCGCGGN